MDFLDILLEAPGDSSKPKTTKIKPDKDVTKNATDYTEEEDDTPDVDDTETDETDTDEGDDDSPTDYTEEEDESDPTEDGADAEDSTDDGTGDEPTDYTDEEDGGMGGDESTDDTSTDSETTEEDANDPQEQENNRILLEDISNLYYLVKNTITKLSNIDKSNILINKIVTQISTNLNVLKKQLFDYITFTFPKGKYVTNLYKYNYFLEAFKINVEMLKKISIFIPN